MPYFPSLGTGVGTSVTGSWPPCTLMLPMYYSPINFVAGLVALLHFPEFSRRPWHLLSSLLGTQFSIRDFLWWVLVPVLNEASEGMCLRWDFLCVTIL